MIFVATRDNPLWADRLPAVLASMIPLMLLAVPLWFKQADHDFGIYMRAENA